MRKLLIQACSQRKINTFNLLPAFDLYDGVNYRVIKKYLRENQSAGFDLKILIISAEYGLISSESLIPTYDHRMNPKRADELKAQVFEQWNKFALDLNQFDKILINAGRDYDRALSLIERSRFERTTGGIGEKMRQLKLWLQ